MARDLKLQVVLQGLDRASKPFREAGRSATGLGRDLKASRTELKGLQAQQSDISSFRALKEASGKTAWALKDARSEVKELAQLMAQSKTPSKELSNEFQRAVRSATALKAAHNKQQAELQGLRGKLNATGISTRNLSQHERDLKAKVSATNQAITQQEARLKRLTAQQQRLARAKQQYDKTQGLAGSMAATGAGGLATGSGILYAGARMLAPGLDFDASMSKVQALTRLSGDSPELAALREQARQLGASTQFTAGNAADAQGFLAMAGFNPQAIRAAMPGMLALAKAGDSELADTADIASNILTGFNLQAGDMGRVGDVLVGAFTRSNTNLQMLGETMKYVAPVAAGVGQDIETMAAMAGKLGDAGIQGSMGGTALRAIISRLAKPPKMAAKALEELGIQAADADGNLRDMPSILTELYDKTKALGSADQAGYFKAIAGEEAFSALQVLTQQAGNGELQKFIGTLREANGEAEQTARVMGDNLRGDLKALGSAWEDLGIQISDQQNGPLRGITQGITKVIGSVKTWVAENPALASQLVKTAAGLGLVMAGMGGLTLAMASILGPFAMVRYGMMLFGIRGAGLASTLFSLGKVALPLVATGLKALAVAAMANPILAIITGIALGAGLIYEHWDRIVPFFQNLWPRLKAGATSGVSSVWNEIQTGFSGGLAGISALILNFSPLGLFYRAFAGVMSYFGVDMPARFSEFGSNIVQGLINGFTSMFPRVTALISGVADSIVTTFKGLLGIHSPSRVFAELGGDTMAGLSQGLEHSQGGPLQALGDISKRLTQAGAVSLALTTAPAIAGPLPEQVQPLRYAPAQLAPQQPTPLQQPVKQVLQGLSSEALPEQVQPLRYAPAQLAPQQPTPLQQPVKQVLQGLTSEALPEQVQPLRYAPAQLAPQQPTPLQQPVKQVLQGLTSEALPEQVQPLRYAPAQLAPQQPTPLQQPVKQVLQGLTSEALPELVQRVRVELDLPNGMPTIGAPIPFDTRPPLAAAGAGSAPAITIGGDTLHITIGGGSGLDIASLRQMFNQLMDEQAAKKAARMRSALYDQE